MSNLHALIIDDNAQNLRVLAQLLSKQGVTTTEITNPSDIEAIIPTLSQVDLVFIDLEMPNINGYDVMTLLRSKYPNIPMVACTVHNAEINNARDAGFTGFLGKPLDIGRFPEQLARILRNEPVWDRN